MYPYLPGFEGGITQGPLAAFQSREADEDGTWQLLSAVLKAAKVEGPGRRQANLRFREGWPELAALVAAGRKEISDGPRFVPCNRLDDQGFQLLLDPYFAATAHYSQVGK